MTEMISQNIWDFYAIMIKVSQLFQSIFVDLIIFNILVKENLILFGKTDE